MSFLDDFCPGCNHHYGDRCGKCGREFMCGEVSEPCDRAGCAELVIARCYDTDYERRKQAYAIADELDRSAL